ncbi:MAG: pyridoxal kinase PdxY [Campylobacterales bacterium]|nr:pyridoxal kinase PdxY [Campylobacterales bacterium]
MNILSIQSHVVYGHVGNAAAVFPMQRLGVEVWPIHTVQFSNHTGYGSWKGRVFDGQSVDELLEGLEEREVLGRCDGVVSGYMGSPDLGYAILSAVEQVKKANPKALYCCDPVIGDVGRGIFVRPGIPEFMNEHALGVADIITPNHFELEYLSGQDAPTEEAVKSAIQNVQAKGPRIVLVTSVQTKETPSDALDLVASENGQFWRVRTPKLGVTLNGAGDAIAALFFVHYLRSRCVKTALGEAAASVYGLLKKTELAGSREILLVAAQEEIIAPTWRFEVEEL